jgi:hypothetical protein
LLTNNLILQNVVAINAANVIIFAGQVEAFRAQHAAAINTLQVSLVDKQ